MCECTKTHMLKIITEHKRQIEIIQEERRKCDLSFKMWFIYYAFVFYCILPLLRLFIDKKTYTRQAAKCKESFLSQKWYFERQKVLNSSLAYHKTSIAMIKNRLIYWDFEPCEHNIK